MRFVSVVVPLWLIAITSVSAMSAESRKPDSSVASRASTVTACDGPSARCSAATRLWPATAAVP